MADDTTIGRPYEQGIVRIPAQAHDKPGLLALETVDSEGVRFWRYFWVSGAGDLRCDNTVPADQDVDGEVVGDQTGGPA